MSKQSKIEAAVDRVLERRYITKKISADGKWKAKVYHKRIYISDVEINFDISAAEMFEILQKSKEKFPIKVEGTFGLHSDQATAVIRSSEGKTYFMDVNWELINKDLPLDLEGAVEIEKLKDVSKEDFLEDAEIYIRYGTFFIDETFELFKKGIDTWYKEYGPEMISDWLSEGGGDSPGIKVDPEDIEVEYVGEDPQIEMLLMID